MRDSTTTTMTKRQYRQLFCITLVAQCCRTLIHLHSIVRYTLVSQFVQSKAEKFNYFFEVQHKKDASMAEKCEEYDQMVSAGKHLETTHKSNRIET
jgi:hypothetical protein